MTHSRTPGFGLWLLIAAAILLRSAVPTGWMPVAGESGLRIVLCSGSGPVEPVAAKASHDTHSAHHDMGGMDHSGDHGSAPHDPCPFGLALAKAFDLPPALAVVVLPEQAAALDGPARVTARLVAIRSLRPPARGPPSFA